jgi:hypothetical protein
MDRSKAVDGVYLEESVFVQRAGVVAFHVVLARPVTKFDGSQAIERVGPLNVAQATALGYDLEAVLGQSLVQALAALDAERARTLQLEAGKAALEARVAELEAAAPPAESP